MQDRYTYDIGDYAKCGLLRSLAGDRLTLGVIWYFTQLGSKGNDGRHLEYLKRPEFGRPAQDLFDLFVKEHKNRKLTSFERSGALPRGTLFARDEVPRARDRSGWFAGATRAVADADLVFCDPDNGISSERMERKGVRSRRHIIQDEIEDLWNRGRSLVLYHTCNRLGSHEAQIARMLRRLERTCSQPWAVRFRAYSPRVFFVLPQRRHDRELRRAFESFARSEWMKAGFEVVS